MKSIQICLGENIRKLRVERGFTQSQFAKKTDLSISFLQNIEAGKRWVGPETIATLAKTLKVSESELFLDCAQTLRPDPKEIVAFLCEAFGVILTKDIISKAPIKRPFAYYSPLYDSIPDEVGEDLVALCKHPQWDWGDFRSSLTTIKKKYR